MSEQPTFMGVPVVMLPELTAPDPKVYVLNPEAKIGGLTGPQFMERLAYGDNPPPDVAARWAEEDKHR